MNLQKGEQNVGVTLTHRMERRLLRLEQDDPGATIVGTEFGHKFQLEPLIRMSDGTYKRVTSTGRLLKSVTRERS